MVLAKYIHQQRKVLRVRQAVAGSLDTGAVHSCCWHLQPPWTLSLVLLEELWEREGRGWPQRFTQEDRMSPNNEFSLVILFTPMLKSMTGIPGTPGTSSVEKGRHGVREPTQMQCLLWVNQTAKFSVDVHLSLMTILYTPSKGRPRSSLKPAQPLAHYPKEEKSPSGTKVRPRSPLGSLCKG